MLLHVGTLGEQFFDLCAFVNAFLFVLLLSARFLRENVAPQEGVGMQSDHACACFVRVGRCCLGSVLGSILSCFGRPQASIFVFLFGSVSKGNFWAAPRVPPEARDRD